MHFATRVIKSAFRRAGFEISRAKDTTGKEPLPPDFDTATQDLCRYVRPFTMTSAERIFAFVRP